MYKDTLIKNAASLRRMIGKRTKEVITNNYPEFEKNYKKEHDKSFLLKHKGKILAGTMGLGALAGGLQRNTHYSSKGVLIPTHKSWGFNGNRALLGAGAMGLSTGLSIRKAQKRAITRAALNTTNKND